MSCCGGKRAELSRDRSTRAPSDDQDRPIETVAREERTRTFEYVGGGRLTVRGAVSGRPYRFLRPGDRLEVAFVDAFGMMAEREVRLAKEGPA